MKNESITLTESTKNRTQNITKSITRIPPDVQKEKYEEIKTAADMMVEKVTGYIKWTIDQ